MPTLTWQRADGGTRVFKADGPQTTIGRDSGNGVHVDSTFVSRRHAVIQGSGTAFTITDLGSANGTFVNGTRVQTAPLAAGDTIKLGSETLVFALNGGSSSRRVRILLFGMLGLLAVVLAGVFIRPAPERTSTPASAPAEVAPSGGAVPGSQAPVAGGGGQAPAQEPSVVAPPVAAAPVPATEAPPSSQPAVPAAPRVQGGGEALYDAALAHIKGDRLIEARRLLIEAIEVGPENPSARQRLLEVEATIQARIEQHLVAGQQQVSYLRFREAILEWEQVVAITEPTDPRHQQALEAIERARLRLGGR